jgi:hypothetical protein
MEVTKWLKPALRVARQRPAYLPTGDVRGRDPQRVLYVDSAR